MDFLKSAVASAIAKGSSFPYSFGDRVDVSDSIWTLHNATKREDGSPCSVFTFEIASNNSRTPLARNAVRKSRTLRHPGVIKVLDTIETDSNIYIVTERVVPLAWHVKRKSLSKETSIWGIYTVASTLKFINEDASSVHGAVRASSIFASESGEWKLGGFDVLSSMNDENAVIYTYGSLVPDAARYTPPEVVKGGWESIKRHPLAAVDAYGLGILVYEVFNGSFAGGDQVGKTTNIPPSMHQSYKRLCTANPKIRLSPAHFVEQGKKTGGFFQTPLIRFADDIESLGLKNDEEREEFVNELDELSDDYPEEFFKMKVLPELLKSVEFGGGGPKVLSAIMKIGTKLPPDEYSAKLTPVIVRLFGNPDRALRVCLLDNLPLMIDNLSQKIVNDKIFPQMTSGFTDVAPVVREQTVKAVLSVIGKLSDRTINGDLLKFLARTANDDQPGIRTNTTICLGKIAKYLGQNSRTKVLVAAFTRSLRDPFVHARNAGLLALGATIEFFNEEDCASKVLPAICPSLLDKEKLIRDQANKTLDLYLQRVRKFGSTMADTALPAVASPDAPKDAARIGTSTDKSWAGWAISSFTNKLTTANGEIQTTASSVKPVEADVSRSASVPRPAKASPSTQLDLPKKALRSEAQPLERSFSDQPASFSRTEDETEDVYDAWGAIDDEDEESASKDDDLFGTPATSSPTVDITPTPKSVPIPYDDGGEPDFAGWLAAQSKAKAKKPLPKGLTKPATTTTSSRTPSRTSTTKPRTVVVPAKKIDIKPKDEDEEDGWGDAWD
ncbi:COPI-interacting protein CEX1 [Aspergillus clavatus NRRL 1]|uniref:Protein kinase family protein n=1 Tax=Aspergillus clavatus (strain ATCC 1007 / CBS 513.65 / DSM 816 / NCTC 3887 / NRRL 1 / QM 1276 / 107) TaxID=344612 RepID=A1CQF0_ASPCL|nr:protein kinase family protein [Aspergillus clavatus NRRL 1]EAW07871.1 protein kinase family protein [Aspergillus clavatus NRRL 1]